MTVMFHIDPVPTEVTFRNHQGSSVEVKSGDIWPIPVRGSKYNIQFSKDSVVYSEETGKPTVVEAQKFQPGRADTAKFIVRRQASGAFRDGRHDNRVQDRALPPGKRKDAGSADFGPAGYRLRATGDHPAAGNLKCHPVIGDEGRMGSTGSR